MMARVKRLLSILRVLALLFIVGAVLVALKLKRSRASVGDDESNEFDLTTIFDGLDFSSHATAFSEGAWLGYFGGGKLDLSKARLDPAGASLRLRAIMAGGEVIVPADCRVELISRGIMGGIQNDATDTPGSTDAPTLNIDARALMGGVHILRGEAAPIAEVVAEAEV